MNNSICLVLPYFGTFPNYFKFWLASCRYNPTINFLLFTDNRAPLEYPPNVRVEYCSFDEFRKVMQNAFDFPISLTRPYKICDFRPAFGLAFGNYLKGYDFWGHCDCDMIFGDLRKFITDELLRSNDKLFSRGHLILYRNVENINRFFLNDKNCRSVLTSSDSFLYDEGGGMTPLWDKLAPNQCNQEVIGYDIDITKYTFEPSLNKWRVLDQGRGNIVFRFNRGKLLRYFVGKSDNALGSDEVPYVHFQKRKIDIRTENVDDFLFVPNMFVDYVQPSIERLKGWTKPRIYWDYWNFRAEKAKRKILRFLSAVAQ